MEERRNQEASRLWKHINILEATVDRHDRALSGITYTVYGVPEVPGTGLAHEIPKRMLKLETQLVRTNRFLAGLLATGLVSVIGEIIVRATS